MHSIFIELQPQLGVVVSLPRFEEARSIHHCCQLVGKQDVSVERKYDGEYCQIHVLVSTSPGNAEIQIFSKSGRDSTEDRVGVHDAIKMRLGVGTPESRTQKRCILVGELLVWNEAIMPFYKIRKYVLEPLKIHLLLKTSI